MDRNQRLRTAESNGLSTWGRGRAVRLSAELYSADIPVHFTICANDGRPFAMTPVAEMVCASLENYSQKLRMQLYGYCLMPDHLHVVISPADSGNSCLVFLDRFKSFTMNQFWKLGGTGRLWQASARDRLIRPHEDIARIVSYIANNPVRAGLVERWDQWPHTGIFVYG